MPHRHIPEMTLAEYVAAHNLTTEAVATAIGISQPFAWRLIAGKREASPEVAIRVERWTEGSVKAFSLNSSLAEYEALRSARVRHHAPTSRVA